MYTYKITNIVSAPFWVMGSIESNLRAFCSFNNLSIVFWNNTCNKEDIQYGNRKQ